MTSYIWFYTYVHTAHGWSATPARKPGSLPGSISKEGLGRGVLPSPPSRLPLKPTHCTLSKSISETPLPAPRHRSAGWVALAAQLCLPQILPPLQTQTQVLHAYPSPAQVLLAGVLAHCWPSNDSPPLRPLPLPAASLGRQDPPEVPRLPLAPGSSAGMCPRAGEAAALPCQRIPRCYELGDPGNSQLGIVAFCRGAYKIQLLQFGVWFFFLGAVGSF